MRVRLALVAALALTACQDRPEGEPVMRAPISGETVREAGDVGPATDDARPTFASDCKPVTFEGTPLTHCIADPAIHRIATARTPASGPRSGTIEGWLTALPSEREPDTIAFVMNAGMYSDDLKPVGYFVQDANRLAPLNRADGQGNFHLKPNGVFFGSKGEWQVLDAATFERTVGTRPQFGTQSGPMLVIDGKLHSEFAENGPSRAIRNGVGVDEQGRAHFAISDAPISFGRFARFFRDELRTPNALFLDGNVSALWNPATGRRDGGRVGPLLVVERIR